MGGGMKCFISLFLINKYTLSYPVKAFLTGFMEWILCIHIKGRSVAIDTDSQLFNSY